MRRCESTTNIVLSWRSGVTVITLPRFSHTRTLAIRLAATAVHQRLAIENNAAGVEERVRLGVPAQGQPSFFSPFLRRSAHRLFIIRDNRLLPAGVRPRFFLFETVEPEPLLLPTPAGDRSASIARSIRSLSFFRLHAAAS